MEEKLRKPEGYYLVSFLFSNVLINTYAQLRTNSYLSLLLQFVPLHWILAD